jgi:hypothetical protein
LEFVHGVIAEATSGIHSPNRVALGVRKESRSEIKGFAVMLGDAATKIQWIFWDDVGVGCAVNEHEILC